MLRATLFSVLVFVSTAASAAEPAPQPQASPELLQAALQVVTGQRDMATNQVVQLGAELALARREIDRLRTEQPKPAEPAK